MVYKSKKNYIFAFIAFVLLFGEGTGVFAGQTARFTSHTDYLPILLMPAPGDADRKDPDSGNYFRTSAIFRVDVVGQGDIVGGRFWISGALPGVGEVGAPAGTCAFPFGESDFLSFYTHYFARDWYMGSDFYHQYTANCSVSAGSYGLNADIGAWPDRTTYYYHTLHDSYQSDNPIIDWTVDPATCLGTIGPIPICNYDELVVKQPKPTVIVNSAIKSDNDLNVSIDAANTIDKGNGWSNRLKLKYRYQITNLGSNPIPVDWSSWLFPDSNNPGFQAAGAVLDDYTFSISTARIKGALHVEIHNGFSSVYGLKNTGGAVSFPGGVPTTGNENDFNKHYTVKDFGPTLSPPNNSPSITRAGIVEPDYCVSGPAATVNWDYFDPDGDPQSVYQVQIDNQGSFTSPEHDSGKISCSECRSNFSGAGKLQFNTTYKARVKVWDSKDAESAWFESRSWKTLKHAYPAVSFSWTPQNPAGNETIQFTDATIFSDGLSPSDPRHKWKWSFGDGEASLVQNPKHKYSNEGAYSVNEKVTDSDGFACILAKTINVSKPTPIIKEVPPQR